MQLGQTIVKIRKEKGLTQEEFARKFNVTRQTVSNWENEKSYPDLLTLVKISDEFDCSLDDMLKENPKMTEKMNKNMKMGKYVIIIAVIGAIACLISFIMSLVFWDGMTEAIVFLVMLLICVSVIADYFSEKKIYKNQ